MPVARSAPITEADNRLRPYAFHGVHLSTGTTHALGDCPFCTREAKFCVDLASGLWRCLVCGTGTERGGGNGLVFTRLIHETASQANVATGNEFLAAVAADRRLLSANTVAAWGVCPARDGTWLVPGYAADGRLDQVYRRIRILEKGEWVWRLLPTPGIWPEGKSHALHLPANDFNPTCETLYVCYSDDTEILTRRGWTNFQNLSDDDEVAAWDTSGTIRYEIPRARQRFAYSGEMVRIKSDWCDLLVTPDHRIPAKCVQAKSVRVRLAKDMKSNLQMPVCGTIDEPSNDYPSEAEARLIVAFVADGCIRRGNQIEFGFCKDRKKKRFEELLAATGVPFQVASYGYYLIDRRDAPFLMKWCPDKSWTELALTWPLSIRQAVLEELQHWDGDTTGNSIRYFTSKSTEADIISRMAVLSGWSSQVRQGQGRESHHSDEFTVSILPKSWRVFTSDPTREQYNGMVYCVTVSTGFVVVRRRGKAIVSGNCEGPWDGMALWEVAKGSSCQVIAVPGCNVWRDEWTELCRGKNVVLLFDSDHPRQYTAGGRESRAGYDGMVRVAKRLSGSAATVRWLKWGPDGYDPSKPSGWDVRDELSSSTDRKTALEGLLAKVEDAPREWFNPSVVVAVNGHNHVASVESLPCHTWAECEESWDVSKGGALRWRQDLSDALAVLLAVCASTQQAGNQLFLDLIGSPGSAKTTLCRGLLVSSHCVHLENATKLISGYKKPGEHDKDCSFLARANNKTWITCEFDVLASSPQYRDLMGKVRRIFDGETSATYGNSDEDRIYSALRTPWIRAGTLKMVDHDQSQLGDRFLRFYISDPDNLEKRAITKSAVKSERAALVESTNASSGSILDPKTRRAHALTGGYVDWLRTNIEEELAKVDVPEYAEDFCIDLAELSADLRARPIWNERYKTPTEADECKELPTRLARQFIRISTCLAVVLNKSSVDSAVLRIVRKVALDTASGNSLKMVQWLCSHNPRVEGQLYQETGGLMAGILENWTGMEKERLHQYLAFLCKIDVLERQEIPQKGSAWKLTDRVYDLYLRIMK